VTLFMVIVSPVVRFLALILTCIWLNTSLLAGSKRMIRKMAAFFMAGSFWTSVSGYR